MTGRMIALVIAALVPLPACSGWVTMMNARPYRPLVVPSGEGRDALFARVRATSLAWNPTHLETSPTDRRLTAILQRDEESRDWIVVEVGEGETAITVRTEILVDGLWTSSNATCTSYAYARENAIALEIFSAAPRPLALARTD